MISKKNLAYRLLYKIFIFTNINIFISINIFPPQAVHAQNVVTLPVPGTRVSLSPSFEPALIKGLKVFPDEPFRFNFMVDQGQTDFEGEDLKAESMRLIKYFLASLAIPEEDLWVNLSPYEKDRVIPEGLAQTAMGRDLLAQDYLLKQIMSSLMYPEDKLGSAFWEEIYEQAYQQFGTTDIPVNMFNKVWIVPDGASIYENDDKVFVVDARLKVMLEEDYLAKQKNFTTSHEPRDTSHVNKLSSDIIRQILIPAIEREVNEGKNFAPVRQIYYSTVLSTWFKQTLKNSILSQQYVDQNKLQGIDIKDQDFKQEIYEQYLESFKVGAYDYIREEYDSQSHEIVPKRYFSGGIVYNNQSHQYLKGVQNTSFIVGPMVGVDVNLDGAQKGFIRESIPRTIQEDDFMDTGDSVKSFDFSGRFSEFSIYEGTHSPGTHLMKILKDEELFQKAMTHGIYYFNTMKEIFQTEKKSELAIRTAKNYLIYFGIIQKVPGADRMFFVEDIRSSSREVARQKVLALININYRIPGGRHHAMFRRKFSEKDQAVLKDICDKVMRGKYVEEDFFLKEKYPNLYPTISMFEELGRAFSDFGNAAGAELSDEDNPIFEELEGLWAGVDGRLAAEYLARKRAGGLRLLGIFDIIPEEVAIILANKDVHAFRLLDLQVKENFVAAIDTLLKEYQEYSETAKERMILRMMPRKVVQFLSEYYGFPEGLMRMIMKGKARYWPTWLPEASRLLHKRAALWGGYSTAAKIVAIFGGRDLGEAFDQKILARQQEIERFYGDMEKNVEYWYLFSRTNPREWAKGYLKHSISRMKSKKGTLAVLDRYITSAAKDIDQWRRIGLNIKNISDAIYEFVDSVIDPTNNILVRMNDHQKILLAEAIERYANLLPPENLDLTKDRYEIADGRLLQQTEEGVYYVVTIDGKQKDILTQEVLKNKAEQILVDVLWDSLADEVSGDLPEIDVEDEVQEEIVVDPFAEFLVYEGTSSLGMYLCTILKNDELFNGFMSEAGVPRERIYSYRKRSDGRPMPERNISRESQHAKLLNLQERLPQTFNRRFVSKIRQLGHEEAKRRLLNALKIRLNISPERSKKHSLFYALPEEQEFELLSDAINRVLDGKIFDEKYFVKQKYPNLSKKIVAFENIGRTGEFVSQARQMKLLDKPVRDVLLPLFEYYDIDLAQEVAKSLSRKSEGYLELLVLFDVLIAQEKDLLIAKNSEALMRYIGGTRLDDGRVVFNDVAVDMKNREQFVSRIKEVLASYDGKSIHQKKELFHYFFPYNVVEFLGEYYGLTSGAMLRALHNNSNIALKLSESSQQHPAAGGQIDDFMSTQNFEIDPFAEYAIYRGTSSPGTHLLAILQDEVTFQSVMGDGIYYLNTMRKILPQGEVISRESLVRTKEYLMNFGIIKNFSETKRMHFSDDIRSSPSYEEAKRRLLNIIGISYRAISYHGRHHTMFRSRFDEGDVNTLRNTCERLMKGEVIGKDTFLQEKYPNLYPKFLLFEALDKEGLEFGNAPRRMSDTDAVMYEWLAPLFPMRDGEDVANSLARKKAGSFKILSLFDIIPFEVATALAEKDGGALGQLDPAIVEEFSKNIKSLIEQYQAYSEPTKAILIARMISPRIIDFLGEYYEIPKSSMLSIVAKTYWPRWLPKVSQKITEKAAEWGGYANARKIIISMGDEKLGGRFEKKISQREREIEEMYGPVVKNSDYWRIFTHGILSWPRSYLKIRTKALSDKQSSFARIDRNVNLVVQFIGNWYRNQHNIKHTADAIYEFVDKVLSPRNNILAKMNDSQKKLLFEAIKRYAGLLPSENFDLAKGRYVYREGKILHPADDGTSFIVEIDGNQHNMLTREALIDKIELLLEGVDTEEIVEDAMDGLGTHAAETNVVLSDFKPDVKEPPANPLEKYSIYKGSNSIGMYLLTILSHDKLFNGLMRAEGILPEVINSYRKNLKDEPLSKTSLARESSQVHQFSLLEKVPGKDELRFPFVVRRLGPDVVRARYLKILNIQYGVRREKRHSLFYNRFLDETMKILQNIINKHLNGEDVDERSFIKEKYPVLSTKIDTFEDIGRRPIEISQYGRNMMLADVPVYELLVPLLEHYKVVHAERIANNMARKREGAFELMALFDVLTEDEKILFIAKDVGALMNFWGLSRKKTGEIVYSDLPVVKNRREQFIQRITDVVNSFSDESANRQKVLIRHFFPLKVVQFLGDYYGFSIGEMMQILGGRMNIALWLAESDEKLQKLAPIAGSLGKAKIQLIRTKQEDDFMSGRAVEIEDQQNPGGIDLNPNKIDIKREGKGLRFNLPEIPMESGHYIIREGLNPVIIQMVPIPASAIPALLGLEHQEVEPEKAVFDLAA